MKKSYSIFSLLKNSGDYHKSWEKAWRSPELKPEYDVIIIGGGGHGLATAHHLVRDHGITNVAVVEKGYLGGGNTGRNTMTVRSNHLREASIPFFDKSIEMWEGLSQELNYNIMFSQRGMVSCIQSASSSKDAMRRLNTMHIYGADYTMLTLDEVKKLVPILHNAPNARLPILSGVYQGRAAIARHDAVAWGYARSADAGGVDIIQNCEVKGLLREGGQVTGVETTRGVIRAKKVGVAVAGHAGVIAEMAGLRLPIETHPLQAFASTPIKPILDIVVTCPGYGVYLSQSDKGELVVGGGADPYPSYGQRGSLRVTEGVIAAMTEIFPIFRRIQLLRQWAGMIDISYDNSPIISKTPLGGLYLDVGWGSGGFKAIPISGKMFADLIARDEPHDMIKPFAFNRFEGGNLVVEGAVAASRV
jgi:sarcosine oxidase subunit beta